VCNLNLRKDHAFVCPVNGRLPRSRSLLAAVLQAVSCCPALQLLWFYRSLAAIP